MIFKKYISIVIKHTAPVGLFILLPLLVALYLGYNLINIERTKHILELSTKLENSLVDLESEIAPESFLLKVGRGAWYVFNHYEKEEDYRNYYKDLCVFLNSKPDFYIFNESGSLITHKDFNQKSQSSARKLWNSIYSSYEDRRKCAISNKNIFKRFVGKEFKLGSFIDSRNLLMPILVNTKLGYIYWNNSKENPKKGIMMIFWEIPDFELRLEEILKRYSSSFDEKFIRDYNGKIKTFSQNNKVNYSIKPNFENVYLNTVLIERNDDYIDENGLLWKYVKFEGKYLLAGLKSKVFNFNNYNSNYIKFIAFLALLFIFVYILAEKQQKYYLSIRAKLIILFLIAVFTPVMGFAYLGYQYINDKRDNLITEIGNESRNILLNIDRELGSSGNVFREEFRKLAADYQNYDEDPKIQTEFNEYLAKQELAFIERRTASDAALIQEITNKVIFDGMTEITEAFAKSCIDTMLKTNLMRTIDPGLASALKSPECGLISFFARPDNVQDFVFGSQELYMYWSFLQSKTDSRKLEYVYILQMTHNVLRKYLQKRLEMCKNNLRENKFQIFARYDKKEEWFPNNLFKSKLKTIARRVNYVGKPIEDEINIEGKKYLLLGLKSNKLRGYSFYTIYPYNKIQDELNYYINYIIIGIVFFIVMALLIGYQLANTFLYPVTCLEKGIKAIKERNSEFRIESLQNDEFGSLALSFNKVIGDLKEMELAKYIQESLLPKSLPKLDGYEICFSNKMASAVGGDYFDTILLDEENLCIIIGDVSGHGVASALVMAAAKATFYHGFKETRNLIELFTDLNSVIKTYFSRPEVKKMITLFAIIINLPTGKCVFVDAGHNYPFKISPDGSLTELQMVNVPIGILKKMKQKNTKDFSIENGETVVFYTDGIVEATGKTEEQYGYNRFKNHLSEMANEKPENIMGKLLKEYEKWEDGTEPDDDVTLVVLKRLPS